MGVSFSLSWRGFGFRGVSCAGRAGVRPFFSCATAAVSSLREAEGIHKAPSLIDVLLGLFEGAALAWIGSLLVSILKRVSRYMYSWSGILGAALSELQRIDALGGFGWIEAIQQPLAGIDRRLLICSPVAMFDAVRDAMAVGDDDRRTLESFRFEETP